MMTQDKISAVESARFYHEQGYLILPDVLTIDEIEQLRAETLSICRRERGEVRGLPDFEPTDSDDAILKRTLCIHFPHKISDVMLHYMKHPAIVDALKAIVGPDVKSMQSMLFIKASGKPGQAWHQDEDFIPTRDRSLVGAWIALDDATIENGCLWIIPGSHRHGILWEMEAHDNPDFDCTAESVGFPYTDADSIPTEVKAGAVVFFNGYTLHRSLPNVTQNGYRRALVNHYMSASSLLPWSPSQGESIATADFRDIVMVAGEDPYAWKGIIDVNTPMIRPSGEGGCKFHDEEEA